MLKTSIAMKRTTPPSTRAELQRVFIAESWLLAGLSLLNAVEDADDQRDRQRGRREKPQQPRRRAEHNLITQVHSPTR